MSTPLTPNGERLLVALAELDHGDGRGVTATDLAYKTDLGSGVIRHGDGARGGHSYSGRQQPGFVIGGAVAALARRRYAYVTYGSRSKSIYRITTLGRQKAAELVANGVTPKGHGDAHDQVGGNQP